MKKQGYEYRYLGSKKHKVVALILCLIGGFVGLHYFYVGRKGRGAVNVILAAILAFASGYFIRHRLWVTFYGLDGMTIVDWMKLHWRELVTALTGIPLTIMWIVDMLKIGKGEFRDADGMRLR